MFMPGDPDGVSRRTEIKKAPLTATNKALLLAHY